jgi:hypothetical protein
LRRNLSVALYLVTLSCAAAFTWKLLRHTGEEDPADWAPFKVSDTKLLRLELPGVLFELGKIAMIGGLMLILAYPLAVTLSPLEIIGRGTRVHAAASVGAAIVFGALASAAIFIAKLYGRERVATFGVGAVLAILAALGVSAQADYSRSWSMQRDFWTQFVRLSPNTSEATVFLYRPPEDVTEISAFAWSTTFVLERIYHMPEAWKSPGEGQVIYHRPLEQTVPPPRVLMFNDEYMALYCAGHDVFRSTEWMNRDLPSVVAQYDRSPPKVLLLKSAGNSLVLLDHNPCPSRRDDPPLPPEGIKITGLPRRPMFANLIR